MGTQGPYQREAKELVEEFLAEDCVAEGAADQVVTLFEEGQYVDSLETALRNLQPVDED